MARLTSDDLAVNGPMNVVVEKPQLIEMIRRGDLTLSSFEPRIELVRRSGDIAIVMGEDEVVFAPPAPNAGQRNRRGFTDVLAARERQMAPVRAPGHIVP